MQISAQHCGLRLGTYPPRASSEPKRCAGVTGAPPAPQMYRSFVPTPWRDPAASAEAPGQAELQEAPRGQPRPAGHRKR